MYGFMHVWFHASANEEIGAQGELKAFPKVLLDVCALFHLVMAKNGVDLSVIAHST